MSAPGRVYLLSWQRRAKGSGDAFKASRKLEFSRLHNWSRLLRGTYRNTIHRSSLSICVYTYWDWLDWRCTLQDLKWGKTLTKRYSDTKKGKWVVDYFFWSLFSLFMFRNYLMSATPQNLKSKPFKMPRNMREQHINKQMLNIDHWLLCFVYSYSWARDQHCKQHFFRTGKMCIEEALFASLSRHNKVENP